MRHHQSLLTAATSRTETLSEDSHPTHSASFDPYSGHGVLFYASFLMNVQQVKDRGFSGDRCSFSALGHNSPQLREHLAQEGGRSLLRICRDRSSIKEAELHLYGH